MKEKLKYYYHVLQSYSAAIRAGRPAGELKLIGVTGTSGKSTTSYMIYHILKNCDYKVGLISTVEALAGEEKIDTGLHVTTPDAADLQEILKKMKTKGIEIVVLETSSHSIAQGRLGILNFDLSVITNVKRDHLDWHKTWENYVYAKTGVLRKLKNKGVGFVNKDDNESFRKINELNQKFKKSLVEYSVVEETTNNKESIDGISFEYKNAKFNIPILGEYNIENALAAVKIAEELGISVGMIAKAFGDFQGVIGRMQIMRKSPSVIIVDFAHNEDSLRRSLAAARKLVSNEGNLIAVFGSAGLRDVEKRFTMGKASGELADITIATAEDPRIESLYEINSKIIKGAESMGGKFVKRFKDHKEYLEFNLQNLKISKNDIFAFDEETVDSRYDAIDFAIKISKPGDVIITEGKGHEQSLCFGTTEYPFTDQEAVLKALEK